VPGYLRDRRLEATTRTCGAEVATSLTGKGSRPRGLSPGTEAYYRDAKRRNVIRLLLSYVAPVILLSVYFYFLYERLAGQSLNMHLQAVAENRANTLDL